MELTERERDILLKIAELYIKSGEPVGSRTLQKAYSLPFSPATIRNVMADLEDKGYLFQPHTSAGRVPTDEGLKIYLNSLFIALGREDETLVNRLIESIRSENLTEREEILSKVLDFLQESTGYVGFGINLVENLTVNNVMLLKVSSDKVLIVINFYPDYVVHKVIKADITERELAKISKILTQKFKGKTLQKVKEELIKEIDSLRREISDIIFRLNSHILKSINEIDYFEVQGAPNIINLVSGDAERLKRVIELLEEKTLLLEVLRKFLNEKKKIDVILGSEVKPEIPQVSFVLGKYSVGFQNGGIVGVLGPKRMNYSEIIPLVENVARAISLLLNK
ncbi:heat-inducible transcription repressor HrcA [Balnearium lithotrophicum]|uniref:Heat-inducible transcription repressor HrcA n=2 Tax=Balnearium lithotrophicum TaxID=223788 RepID=A0A521E1R4_9BACT|nr:heat-inducible transcription repressor HrcA [Balnearium lithotrophicum]